MKINERHVIIGAAVAGTVIAGTKYGAFAAIPSLGGISAPLVLIAGGIVLAAVVAKDGPVGAAIEGAGYGLIATGALAFAGN